METNTTDSPHRDPLPQGEDLQRQDDALRDPNPNRRRKAKPTAEAAPAPPHASTLLSLTSLVPSRTNPRRTFDKDALQQLADSIRAFGVLEPIIVRPLRAGAFEIVAGERRYRAAKLAGLTDIPVIVRELDDKAALEIQVVENLQRTDLSPLEEAEGYRQLHTLHGYAVEDLAAKVGMSKAYVYARLKLGDLPAAAKKLLVEGKLTPSTALLVARIPDPKLAEKAAKEICTGGEYGYMSDHQPMSYRAAAEHVQRRYMLRLSDAPWKLADAQLLAGAGPCTTCPKRTGNQPELFDDVKSADVCTDPGCFDRKRQAHTAALLEEARAAGREVLEGAEAKKLFERYDGRTLRSGVAFVEAAGRCDADPKWKPGRTTPRSWRKVLGEHAPPPVVAIDTGGDVHELYPRKDAVEALKAAGIKVERQDYHDLSGARARAMKAADSGRERKLRIARAAADRAIAAIVEAAEKNAADRPAVWQWIASGVLDHVWSDLKKRMAARRGVGEKNAGVEALEKAARSMSPGAIRGLLAECVAGRGYPGPYSGGLGEEIRQGAKLLGVNLVAIEKQVRAEFDAKKPKPAKKAGKK